MKFICDSISNIEGASYSNKRIEVELEGLTIRDVIEQVGVDDILDEIGESEVIKYFNIDVSKEE
jgi:hypothetical protein